MRLISYYHIDQHKELQRLLSQAMANLGRRLEERLKEREEVRARARAYEARPWWHCFVSAEAFMFSASGEAWLSDAEIGVQAAEANIRTVQRLMAATDLEVTIELSDREACLVLPGEAS